MPFSINIFDTQDLNAATVFEIGERGSINLAWLGSKNKLEHILGCELSFNMEVANFQDAFFAHLNTQDERRYWVKLIDEQTKTELWQGYLLPDTYEEPYAVGSFFVKFSASCGLGTLRDQYLPNEFYELEKSKIQLLTAILGLTGLELDIYVSPALSNIAQPYWHQNYIDGLVFNDDGDKEDAYDILTKLMKGSICRILQNKNAWQIEGLNKLNRFNKTYARYNAAGEYLEDVTIEVSPIVKTKKFHANPKITTNTPVKNITAYHELNDSNIDEGVYKVKNSGYVVANDVDLVSRDWVYTSVGFTPKYNTADGKVFLNPLGSNLSQSVKLRKQVLLAVGDRVQWQLECTNYTTNTSAQGRTVEEIVLDGDWEKLLPYDIFYTNPTTGNEVLLYSNVNGADADDLRYQLSFDTDRKGVLSISMIAPATAYYNIRLYQPQAPTGSKVDGVFIDLLALNNISQEDEQAYQNTILETYTKNIETELPLHDDMRQLKNLIRLNVLADQGAVYDTEVVNNITVLNTLEGNYILLPLDTLQLALAHKDAITVGGEPLLVLGVIYNYLDSQEMYLQYDANAFGRVLDNNESLLITLREFAPIPQNIAQWQQWADDFYKVSYKRYGEAYTDVVRNLYQKAHPVLTGTCLGFVGPQDLVQFNYDGDKIWYVLDCEQHLDRFETTVILSQNFYGEAVTENLPPIVDAGPDQVLATGDTDVQLLATATDPDGAIVNILWEVVSAPDAVQIISPNTLATEIDGLNGDAYEFRVTVTDDAGLTASDTVRISRAIEYQVVLNQTIDYELSTNPGNQDPYEAIDREWYKISIEPELAPDQVVRLTIDGVIVLQTPNNIAGAKPSAVFKMGYEFQFFEQGAHQMVTLVRQGVVKTLGIQARAFNSAQYGVFPEYANKVYARVQVDITAEMASGPSGVFTNVPIQLNVEARK